MAGSTAKAPEAAPAAPDASTTPDSTPAAPAADAPENESPKDAPKDPTSAPTSTDVVLPVDPKDPVTLTGDDNLAAKLYTKSEAGVFVTLKQDVIEEFYYPNAKRPAHRVLYAAGQVVPLAEIEAHNRAVAEAKRIRKAGGVDPKNPSGIDASTIAAGTDPGTLD